MPFAYHSIILNRLESESGIFFFRFARQIQYLGSFSQFLAGGPLVVLYIISDEQYSANSYNHRKSNYINSKRRFCVDRESEGRYNLVLYVII